MLEQRRPSPAQPGPGLELEEESKSITHASSMLAVYSAPLEGLGTKDQNLAGRGGAGTGGQQRGRGLPRSAAAHVEGESAALEESSNNHFPLCYKIIKIPRVSDELLLNWTTRRRRVHFDCWICIY